MLYQKYWKTENKVNWLHGEKHHETLLTKEELSKAEEFKEYFKIKFDNRDLNYEKFFSKGFKNKVKNDYTSENTKRLSVLETQKLLTPIVKSKNQ